MAHAKILGMEIDHTLFFYPLVSTLIIRIIKDFNNLPHIHIQFYAKILAFCNTAFWHKIIYVYVVG